MVLQKQVKAHGMDHGLDKPGSKEPGTTVSTDGNFSRAQVLVLPGQSVSTPAKKQPTDRLVVGRGGCWLVNYHCSRFQQLRAEHKIRASVQLYLNTAVHRDLQL
jgi:hypothetical protein